MALSKCKECGTEISKKAKTCPKCGAPQGPKQYSLGKLLVLVIFGVFIYSLFSGNSPQGPSTTSSSSQKSEVTEKVSPPKPTWRTSTSKDEMSGKFTAFAHSPTAYPTKKMSFPYNDVTSWMGVGCDSENEWVYFGFSTSPNLTKDKTKDGYNLINTRIKWDNQVENVTLTQDWGEKFIHFKNDNTEISKISASNTALLELHWHGQQPTFFKYSLNGSSKAIAEIRTKCAKRK